MSSRSGGGRMIAGTRLVVSVENVTKKGGEKRGVPN